MTTARRLLEEILGLFKQLSSQVINSQRRINLGVQTLSGDFAHASKRTQVLNATKSIALRLLFKHSPVILD